MFDKSMWTEMLSLTDDIEPETRMILHQYSTTFNSKGEAFPKLKLMAKTMGMSVADVRKHLSRAQRAAWLEPITIDGKKGYRAILPEELR